MNTRIYTLDICLKIFICLSVGVLCCLFIFQMSSNINKNAVTAFVLSPSLSSSSLSISDLLPSIRSQDVTQDVISKK